MSIELYDPFTKFHAYNLVMVFGVLVSLVLGALCIVLLKLFQQGAAKVHCRCRASRSSFNDNVIPKLEQVEYRSPSWYNKHLGAW